MSAVIGSLEIQLLTNIAKLQSDMDKSKAVVSDTMKQIESAVNLAKQAFVAMTGVASVNALKGIVLGSIESIAKLNDLAIQSGITVEALSGLASVGKATGTGADTIAAASNKFSKALASANEDSKGAATALKALGLSFEEFQHMSPDEQMQKIAVAMGSFQDGGQKSAAAMMLFGKTGAEMLPFLKDLATAGELHAKVTTEQGEAAHQFEVTMGQLKTRSDAWKKTLAMDLLPTLNDIAKVVMDNRKSTGDLGITFGEVIKVTLQWGAVLSNTLLYILKEVGIAIAMVGAIATNPSKGKSIFAQYLEDAKALTDETHKTNYFLLGYTNSNAGGGRGGTSSTDPRSLGVGEDFKPKITGLNGNGNGAQDSSQINEGLSLLNRLQTEYEGVTGAVSKYAQAERDLAAMKKPVSELMRYEILDYAKSIDLKEQEKKLLKEEAETRKQLIAYDVEQANKQADQDKRIEDFVTAGNDARASIVAQTVALGMNSDELTKHNALLQIDTLIKKAMVGATVETRQELEKLGAVMKGGMSDALDALKAKQDALNGDWHEGAKNALEAYQKNVSNVAAFTQTAFSNAFKGMEDALVSFVTTGKLDFTSLVNSMIADLVRYQIQQSIMKPLMSSLSGKGGGIEVSSGGFLDSALKFFGFANGGQPPVGVPSIVGEKGPELFIPNTPGTVVPNSKLGGGGSQINYAPVISIDSRTDRADVYANVQNALAKNNEAFARMLRQQGVMQ